MLVPLTASRKHLKRFKFIAQQQ